MERIFVFNVKYGKIAINPDGIKAVLANNSKAKKEEKVETPKVKTK